jgi:hypothetical protein
MVVSMALVPDIRVNNIISSAWSILNADASNSGEFGVESGWKQSLRNRISLGVKTASDLAMFSGNARQGIWKSAYRGGCNDYHILCRNGCKVRIK